MSQRSYTKHLHSIYRLPEQNNQPLTICVEWFVSVRFSNPGPSGIPNAGVPSTAPV